MVGSFITFGSSGSKELTHKPRLFRLGVKKPQLWKPAFGKKAWKKGCLSALQMTWPPRRTANLRIRQDSTVVSLPLKFDNSSLVAAKLDYLQNSEMKTETKRKADRKLILVSFPEIPGNLTERLFKSQPYSRYLQDARLFTDWNFLLCEEKIHNVSATDWNLLNLFGLSPSTNYKYKRSSWVEKLTVFIADVICDFLVLDALWQLDSFADFASFFVGGFFAFITADFISGIYNWASRNYFSNTDSCYVSLVSKRSHSKAGGCSSEDEEVSDFFSNVYWYCLFTIPFLATLTYFRDDLPIFFNSFLIFFLSLLAIWPEAHKWGHMADPERPPPPVVCLLQSYGLLIPIHEHLWHHDSHLFYRTGTEDSASLEVMNDSSQTAAYCAISGHWNRFLDITGFFRKLEWLIYCLFRIEPKIWSILPHLKEGFVDMDSTE
ncbi:Fatty acid desaturase 4-like 1, chloroplastic [Galdieria sulphuraria]|nr:Fatty acid desaturase 4-like 1, chloroplastic [Galdieria sulphuraria]